MHFNENTRVKIPAILHLCRLGYRYLSLKSANWDEATNIFPDIFKASVRRLNPEFDEKDAQCIYDEVALCLENEDLGRAFHEKLINRSGTKLIDFEDFSRNSLHVVTELPCRKDDEAFYTTASYQKPNYKLKLKEILEIDTPMCSKIERGDRKAKRTQVIALSQRLSVETELLSLRLEDKVLEYWKEIVRAEKALMQYKAC